jgi:hypothetical protein
MLSQANLNIIGNFMVLYSYFLIFDGPCFFLEDRIRFNFTVKIMRI